MGIRISNPLPGAFSKALTDTVDGDELVLRRQFHFEMALYAAFGQIALYVSSRKDDASAIVSNGRHCFGGALINGQELVVGQVESEADNMIGHEMNVPA